MARSKLEEAHDILENAERGGDASFVASHLLGWARLMQDYFEHEHPGRHRAARADRKDG